MPANKDYTCKIIVSSPPSVVFAAISNISGWWSKCVEGNANNSGDKFTVRFGNTFVTFRVRVLASAKRIEWRVISESLNGSSDSDEWLSTTILWQIDIKDGQTQLSMTHVGMRPEKSWYTDSKEGWDHYIGLSLHNFIINNQGFPD